MWKSVTKTILHPYPLPNCISLSTRLGKGTTRGTRIRWKVWEPATVASRGTHCGGWGEMLYPQEVSQKAQVSWGGSRRGTEPQEMQELRRQAWPPLLAVFGWVYIENLGSSGFLRANRILDIFYHRRHTFQKLKDSLFLFMFFVPRLPPLRWLPQLRNALTNHCFIL